MQTIPQNKKLEDRVICFVCSGSQHRISYPNVVDLEYDSKELVNFAVCPDCGIVQQYPLPAKELLPSFYPANYRNYLVGNGGLLKSLKVIQADLFARKIFNYIKNANSKSILDIGFGNGQLLSSLARVGCKNLSGSDFNERACPELESAGIRLAFSDVEESFPFDEKFDCIIMNNVIEHFLEPAKVLTACKEHLRPQGKVILITPSVDALELDIFKRFWAGFHSPRHTILFGRKSIEQMARNVGFKNIRIESYNDPGQWAISIQNFLQNNNATKTQLQNGLAWYTVPLSLALSPIVALQGLSKRSTAVLCVLENQ